jgi:predicted MFS family arabinose efflux permease
MKDVKGNRKKDFFVVITLFVVALISYANNIMVSPLLMNMAESFKTSAANIGLLVTIYGIIAGFIALIAGPISDEYGRKKTLVCFTFLTAISTMLFAFSWNLNSLYVFRVLNALTVGPLIFSSLAYIGDYFPPERRGAVIGVVTSAIFMASIFCVPIGLLLTKLPNMDWRGAFAGIGLVAFIMTIVAAISLKDFKIEEKTERLSVINVLKKYLQVLAVRELLGFILIFLFVRVAAGMFLTYYPNYLMSVRALPVNGLVLVYSLGGLCAFATNIISGKLADRISRKKMAIIASIVITSVMLAIINIETTPLTILSVVSVISICYMTAEAFRMTSLQTEALRVVSGMVRGLFLGTISFLLASGDSIGAAIGSIILRNFPKNGFDVITYISAASIFVSIIFMASHMKEKEVAL